MIQNKKTNFFIASALLLIILTIVGYIWSSMGLEHKQIETRQAKIPVAVQYEQVDTLPEGTQELVQTGSEGVEEVNEEIIYEKGKPVHVHEIGRTIITPMKPTIIRTGVSGMEMAKSHGQIKQVLTMEATAYLPTDGGGDGITASGIEAKHGIVAVDPNVIPLGTKLYIPGYGEALAADTGGDIVGARIDVVMEDYGEAMQFGRRTVEVYVL